MKMMVRFVSFYEDEHPKRCADKRGCRPYRAWKKFWETRTQGFALGYRLSGFPPLGLGGAGCPLAGSGENS